MPEYTERAFTGHEAAQIIGITKGHLAVIIHRNKPIVRLISGKQKGRRLYSPRDIAILRLAHLLERFGRNHLFGIADGIDLLDTLPDREAVLVVQLGRSTPWPVRTIYDRDITRLQVDESTLLIPIGKEVSAVVAKCAEQYEKAQT